MESIVWPARANTISVFGIVHRLGLEVGGLASIGRNPVDFLRLVRPEGLSLFEHIGAGPYVTANMLLSHGSIDAGRNAELLGPAGHRENAKPMPGMRTWNPAERIAYPSINEIGLARKLAENVAAQFDAAVALAREKRVDLLMLRVEDFDVTTHTFYAQIAQSGKDDGQGVIWDIYRYADTRLQELWQALDADDVFIVMSDHGIRSALDHSEDAVFLAMGPGIPAGRAEGQPDIEGLPRALADILSVPSTWKDTGIAPWARSSRADPRAAAAKPAP
jgi:hypothetical protein